MIMLTESTKRCTVVENAKKPTFFLIKRNILTIVDLGKIDKAFDEQG